MARLALLLSLLPPRSGSLALARLDDWPAWSTGRPEVVILQHPLVHKSQQRGIRDDADGGIEQGRVTTSAMRRLASCSSALEMLSSPTLVTAWAMALATSVASAGGSSSCCWDMGVE